MSIYPDKNGRGQLTGRWRVEVQLNGLRKRGRFPSMDEAKAAEKRWTRELAEGVLTEADQGVTFRVDQNAPVVLSHLLAKAAPMLWNPDKHGTLSIGKVEWIIRECGDCRLDHIPTDFCDRIVVKLRKLDKAPATINRYLSALHAVLGWGAKPGRGYVPVMPEFSWQDEDDGRIRWLTPDEEHHLLATLHALGQPEVADLCIVAIDTGCRRSELLTAKRDQLDGKWLRLWKTKNGKARSVPLSDRAQAILQARLPDSPSGLLFTVTESQLRKAWDRARIAMGLSDDTGFVFHALRHTRATRLVEMGVNLRVIQQFMGHSAIQTTLRYAHVSDDMLARAGADIDRWNSVNLPTGAGEPEAGDRPPLKVPLSRPRQRSVLEAAE